MAPCHPQTSWRENGAESRGRRVHSGQRAEFLGSQKGPSTPSQRAYGLPLEALGEPTSTRYSLLTVSTFLPLAKPKFPHI